MADLFDRLFAETENIPIHAFRAALVDYAVGETTRAQIINYWSLDSSAQSDLNTLCDAIDSKTALEKVAFCQEFDAVCNFAENEIKYATKSAFATRLGLT